MATPHHHTAPRRRSGDGVRSAAPSHPAPATPGSRLLHKPARRSLRRAVWRNPKSLPTASVLVASVRIRAARQHGSTAARRAPPRWLRAPSALHPLPARPPSCTTHPAAHTSSRERCPHGCRSAAHASSCTRPWWRGSRTHMRTPRPLLPVALNAVERTLRCTPPCISPTPLLPSAVGT